MRLVAVRTVRPLDRIIAALALVTAVSACADAVRLPPDLHDPRSVMEAYLTDISAGDCAAALALSTAGAGDGLCGATRVTAHRLGLDVARPGPDLAIFTAYLTTTGTADGSIDPGPLMWFYSVSRQLDGTWRVSGGGSGP